MIGNHLFERTELPGEKDSATTSLLKYLSTHPDTQERIEQATQAVSH